MDENKSFDEQVEDLKQSIRTEKRAIDALNQRLQHLYDGIPADVAKDVSADWHIHKEPLAPSWIYFGFDEDKAESEGRILCDVYDINKTIFGGIPVSELLVKAPALYDLVDWLNAWSNRRVSPKESADELACIVGYAYQLIRELEDTIKTEDNTSL